jgi:L-fuculose-phosphate aldolase
VSMAGAVIAGSGAPSSELGLHLAAYRTRADVMAVVHAHPPIATALTLIGETIPDGVLAELMLTVGTVALVPYAQPGTPELGRLASEAFLTHDALLLAHHGAVTVGRTLEAAHFAMESLEHGARIVHAARQIGNVVTLPPAACEALREARRGARNDAAPPGRNSGE